MPGVGQAKVRYYERNSCVVFRKTTQAFGGLSNMASGYPLEVNGIKILTSEALYQACRFPHLPEVQRAIIAQHSPMTAKMKGKPFRKDSRPDWDQARVRIMKWCLRAKLTQNWERFSQLLVETAESPIVEESRRDDFWGAKAIDEETLVGMNVLGRLLMELRELVISMPAEWFLRLEPLPIDNFNLFGAPILPISNKKLSRLTIERQPKLDANSVGSASIQRSMFEDRLAGDPMSAHRIDQDAIETPGHWQIKHSGKA